MSYAPNYTPGNSFADDEANNVAGRSLVKTDSLDAELADISTSINNLNGNLQALQRDDNKLKDGIIEPYAFSEQTNALIATAGCNPRGTWAQNTDYAFKDIIQRNNIAQICLQAHNSGSAFTQSFWLPISGDGTSAANAAAAAASATAALNSSNSASASATTASTAATNASNSASSASTSATNSANSASSAATSATNSSNSAIEANASAVAAASSAASINAPESATSDPTGASTSSTKAISASWAKLGFTFSFGSSGYFFLPKWLGGFGFQWGAFSVGGAGSTGINFPTPFPTACYLAKAGITYTGSGAPGLVTAATASPTTSGFTLGSSGALSGNYISLGR